MPELLLTNTQTGGKERFEPRDPERITLYVCGPTVYNLVHIFQDASRKPGLQELFHGNWELH